MFCDSLYWTNHILCYISLTGTSGTSRSRGTSRNKGWNGRNPTYIAYVHLYVKGNSFSIVELVCTDIKLFGTFNQNIYALNTHENKIMVNSQKKLKQSWGARNLQRVECWPFPLIIMQQAVIIQFTLKLYKELLASWKRCSCNRLCIESGIFFSF